MRRPQIDRYIERKTWALDATMTPFLIKIYCQKLHNHFLDLGLHVLTSLSLGQYIKVSVQDFSVITEQTKLISYLLDGLFIMDLSLQSIKTNRYPF